MIGYYNTLREKVQNDRGTALVLFGLAILLLDLIFKLITGETRSQIVATYLWDGLIICVIVDHQLFLFKG